MLFSPPIMFHTIEEVDVLITDIYYQDDPIIVSYVVWHDTQKSLCYIDREQFWQNIDTEPSQLASSNYH